jgi:hypothetical protein
VIAAILFGSGSYDSSQSMLNPDQPGDFLFSFP